MKLTKVEIRNFRCFNRFSMEFGKRATILFGKNGTGKSSLIHALHKALSFIMFSEKIYEYTKVNGKKKRQLVTLKSITKGNPYLKVEGFKKIGDNYNIHHPLVEIKTFADLQPGLSIHWAMSAFITNFILRPSEFKEAFLAFYDWFEATNKLPVLAYYSDSFPHKEDVSLKKYRKNISDLRNFGYFDWNDEEGCTKEWLGRLERNLKNIRTRQGLISRLRDAQTKKEDVDNAETISALNLEIKKWEKEVKAIEAAILEFSHELLPADRVSIDIAGIAIHSEYDDICVITNQGKEISFLHLPSGYKRLLSLVLDLAYRCYIINEGDVKDAKGIVIIDEIDLHLHPELEKVVMPRLLKVFPGMQFIVSTHSVNVLTSLSTNEGDVRIVSMPSIVYGEEDNDDYFAEPSYFTDVYGLDSNRGLSEIMGVTPNDDELRRLIDRCAYLKLNNFEIQAKNLKKAILSKNLISEEELDKRINEKLGGIE